MNRRHSFRVASLYNFFVLGQCGILSGMDDLREKLAVIQDNLRALADRL